MGNATEGFEAHWLHQVLFDFPKDLQAPATHDVLRESRVEEWMLKLRGRYYQLFSRCLSHITLMFSLYFLQEALKRPGLGIIIWVMCGTAAYVQHLVIGTKLLDCTPYRLKFLSYMLHVVVFLFILGTAGSATRSLFSLQQSFVTGTRFLLVLTFLDPWVSIPFQVLYTTTQVVIHLKVFGEQGVEEMEPLCFTQFVVFGISTASSVFIDMALRGRIYAQLDSSDAESLVSGFRRVLRGACDGEVLLDNHMNVAQESECLKHLILTDVSLKGRSFQHLLVEDEDEQARFGQFIEASTQAFGRPDSKDSACPSSLRISLRTSAGIRVGADICHVPVPGGVRFLGWNEGIVATRVIVDLDNLMCVPLVSNWCWLILLFRLFRSFWCARALPPYCFQRRSRITASSRC